MKTYTFRTCNGERCHAVHMPAVTTVKAPDEATARHLAMTERWRGRQLPFPRPARFQGLGLILETVDGVAPEV